MFRWRKINSTFYRLFFSYAILTGIITISIGAALFIFFGKNYNNEIEINNKHIFEYERNALESDVFGRVQSIYLDLSLKRTNNDILSFFISNDITGNHAMLTRLMDTLYDTVYMNSEIIDSICIYYDKVDILVSSTFGLKYLDTKENESYKNMKWLDNIKNSNGTGLNWILSNEYNGLSDRPEYTFALSGRYPWVYDSNKNDAYMIIFINIVYKYKC